MEVHKHPHDVTHKKKWNEYLLEFFMIFLAVTLGFLAENQREHFAEHKQEIQYVKSMLADLQIDTAILHKQEGQLKRRWTGCDSIAYFLRSENIKNFGAEIYYYGRVVGFYKSRLFLTSRTLDQLKSAGMFRLIQDHEVADSILEYDEEKKDYESRIENLLEVIKDVQDQNKLLFDTKVFEAATEYTDSFFSYKYSNPLGNPALLSYEAGFLQRYYNGVYYLKRVTEACFAILYECLRMNKSLTETIKKEYHLN